MLHGLWRGHGARVHRGVIDCYTVQLLSLMSLFVVVPRVAAMPPIQIRIGRRTVIPANQVLPMFNRGKHCQNLKCADYFCSFYRIIISAFLHTEPMPAHPSGPAPRSFPPSLSLPPSPLTQLITHSTHKHFSHSNNAGGCLQKQPPTTYACTVHVCIHMLTYTHTAY